jgi:DNA-binding GntR family transcriptional regulator
LARGGGACELAGLKSVGLNQRLGVSRTPVRHGWRVLAFNFEQFEQLYDLRIVLETMAIDRLAEGLI